MKKKPLILCAGHYESQRPIAQCTDCQRRPAQVPERGYWMAPPDFDDLCPDQLPKEAK